MSRRKGKRVAVVAIVVGAVIAGLAARTLKDRIVEGRHLHRLGSDDLEEKCGALEWLGTHGSLRAVQRVHEEFVLFWPDYFARLSSQNPMQQDDPSQNVMPVMRARVAFRDAFNGMGTRLLHSDREVRTALMSLLRSRTGTIRSRIVAARGLFMARSKFPSVETKELEAAYDVLEAALSSPDPWSRREAAWTLSGLGPLGEKALPELKRLLHDDDIGIQKSAYELIQHLKASSSSGPPVRSEEEIGPSIKNPSYLTLRRVDSKESVECPHLVRDPKGSVWYASTEPVVDLRHFRCESVKVVNLPPESNRWYLWIETTEAGGELLRKGTTELVCRALGTFVDGELLRVSLVSSAVSQRVWIERAPPLSGTEAEEIRAAIASGGRRD